MKQHRSFPPRPMDRITWRTLPSHGSVQIYRGRITWWTQPLIQAIITHSPLSYDLGWHRLINRAEVICIKPKTTPPANTKELPTTPIKKSKYKLLTAGFSDGYRSHAGELVHIEDTQTGDCYYGKIRLKEVRCGHAGCTKCPHKVYAYAQFRVGSKVTEKYLGLAR